MADYGASIILSKKDKTLVTETEIKKVQAELEKIKNSDEYSDALGSDFLYKIVEINNDNTALHVLLSEYWHGEGDDEENFEFAKENDEDESQKIAEELRQAFNEIFNVEPNFENW